ncbi:hypothetical protein G4B88_007566 [Cannabis sativa]|uniref:UBC core domain-containing protein n=1 Tax=Cannabis sativa TaxID=3483 RepID=A0A7J6HSP0_CANSA|nr:hypothetical protein G4B88_007566 [Cannabis sativa]
MDADMNTDFNIAAGKKLYFKGKESRLSLSFSNDYPFKPPEVKFETSCFHILMWMYVATFVWTFFTLSFVNCDWSRAHLRWGFVKGSRSEFKNHQVRVSRKLSDPRKQQDYEVKTTIDIKSSHVHSKTY